VVTIGLLVGMVRERIASPQVRAMIDKVDDAAAALESLLKGLLDLSRFDAGTIKPRVQTTPLQGLFDAIEAHEAESARSKGLRLALRSTPLAVRTDPLLLEQILRNLVQNAIRYTDRGGVLVAARGRGDRVLLQVWDTGCGIAPAQQSAVFEEFVQIDNPGRDRARGLGLGLAIVKRTADLLGHRIGLRSMPRRGSCFSVEVPAAPSQRIMPASVADARTPLYALDVLVLEDDGAVRASLAARLEGWGARVRAIGDLAQLRGLLKQPLRIDLLVTDQRLPSGSGLEAIALVRAHLPAVAALVVTGNTAPDELATLTSAGVPVLHKPFRAAALLRAIEEARGATAASGRAASVGEGGVRA
jgi:CheY-like chemotaxis protein